jgi:hypothetical protein
LAYYWTEFSQQDIVLEIVQVYSIFDRMYHCTVTGGALVKFVDDWPQERILGTGM